MDSTSTSHFDGRNNPMKTPNKLIDVELEYHLDVLDIERLVEATRILMEVLGDEVDTEEGLGVLLDRTVSEEHDALSI
jgi:hypothetical protein